MNTGVTKLAMETNVAGFWLLTVFILAKSAVSENVVHFSMENPPGTSLSSLPVTVTVNLQQSVNQISSHFIGLTIDDGTVKENWSTLNLSSPRVQSMARALTPSYFRLGGTYADAMTYDLNGDHPQDLGNKEQKGKVGVAKFNMTAQQWVALNEFIQSVNWEMIMDLNALKRYANGSWNPENARQLLQFSADRNYTIAGFELGNEYDFYELSFNVTVTPEQLAEDVVALQKLLSEFPAYYSSFIIGPEAVHKFYYYVLDFLAKGGSDVVRAASFHQYYFNAADRNLTYFTSIKMMDSLANTLSEMFEATHIQYPQLPIWLSETSSAYGSGVANMSDRFVAGFMWLDKLGMCSVKGVQTVLRQSFYGGHYSLIDSHLNPNPDFWLTWLYKRLIRGDVFVATARQDVRVYAACQMPDRFPLGSLVVYMLNPNNYSVTFDLPQFRSQPRLIYSLTAGDGDGRLSKYICLNGVKLELVSDEMPPLDPPKSIPPGPVTTPPYSYTFLIFPEAAVSICKENV